MMWNRAGTGCWSVWRQNPCFLHYFYTAMRRNFGKSSDPILQMHRSDWNPGLSSKPLVPLMYHNSPSIPPLPNKKLLFQTNQEAHVRGNEILEMIRSRDVLRADKWRGGGSLDLKQLFLMLSSQSKIQICSHHQFLGNSEKEWLSGVKGVMVSLLGASRRTAKSQGQSSRGNIELL